MVAKGIRILRGLSLTDAVRFARHILRDYITTSARQCAKELLSSQSHHYKPSDIHHLDGDLVTLHIGKHGTNALLA